MNIKNLGFWDIGLVKLYVLAVTFFLVSVWPGLATWVMDTHWAWFLGAAIIFVIKPVRQLFKK